MNERIKELADQAELTIRTSTGTYMSHPEFNKKFAELIIRECMRMCDVAAVGYETHGHMKEANGCASARECIEEHFGVEE